MKFCTILFLFIGFLHVHLVAQEKDTLRVKNISAPISGVEFPKLQMDKDLKASPEIFLNPDFSLKSEPFALKSMNFKFPGDWKIERGTGFLSNNLLEINPKGFFRLSGWNSFYGYYGSKTYQVNNKFFVGTAAFSDRNPYPGWIASAPESLAAAIILSMFR